MAHPKKESQPGDYIAYLDKVDTAVPLVAEAVRQQQTLPESITPSEQANLNEVRMAARRAVNPLIDTRPPRGAIEAVRARLVTSMQALQARDTADGVPVSWPDSMTQGINLGVLYHAALISETPDLFEDAVRLALMADTAAVLHRLSHTGYQPWHLTMLLSTRVPTPKALND